MLLELLLSDQPPHATAARMNPKCFAPAIIILPVCVITLLQGTNALDVVPGTVEGKTSRIQH